MIFVDSILEPATGQLYWACPSCQKKRQMYQGKAIPSEYRMTCNCECGKSYIVIVKKTARTVENPVPLQPVQVIPTQKIDDRKELSRQRSREYMRKLRADRQAAKQNSVPPLTPNQPTSAEIPITIAGNRKIMLTIAVKVL
jgi:hypothetical protein